MQNMQQRFREKWIKSLQCCRKTIKWINKSNLPKVRLPLKSFFLWILQRWTSQWRKIKKTIGAFSARCRLGKCKRARSRTPTHHLCLTTAWIVHHPSFLGVFLPSSFGSRSNTCKHTHTRARARGGWGRETPSVHRRFRLIRRQKAAERCFSGWPLQMRVRLFLSFFLPRDFRGFLL